MKIKMEFIDCPICQDKESEVLYNGATDRMHGIPGLFKYARCKRCGHVYLNPRPEPESLKSCYPDSYAMHNPLKRPKGSIVSNYLSPAKRAAAFLKGRITEDSSVLDIGCGRGDFLYRLKNDTGCRCYGVDFIPKAARQAKEEYGIDVFLGRIQDAPYPQKMFNLITMWWYLEHDPYPLKTISRSKELLRDDGWLVFAVPNYRSLNAALFGKSWFHLDAPRHLSIFSPGSIKHLLDKAGFRIHRVDWDRSTWGLVGSMQYLLWGRGYDAPFNITEKILFRLLSLPASLSASLLKLSDTVTVYARKS